MGSVSNLWRQEADIKVGGLTSYIVALLHAQVMKTPPTASTAVYTQ